MKQAVWLLGLLCLQVCLLSTTALHGPDRRTATLQTNQAMEGSSPVIPRSPPQNSLEKVRSECRKDRKMCRSRSGAMGPMAGSPGPNRCSRTKSEVGDNWTFVNELEKPYRSSS